MSCEFELIKEKIDKSYSYLFYFERQYIVTIVKDINLHVFIQKELAMLNLFLGCKKICGKLTRGSAWSRSKLLFFFSFIWTSTCSFTQTSTNRILPKARIASLILRHIQIRIIKNEVYISSFTNVRRCRHGICPSTRFSPIQIIIGKLY